MAGRDRLAVGKLPRPLLERLVRYRGAASKKVLLGPAIGEDAAALKTPAGHLVVATDPVTFTAAHAGWYCVHINANDVAVCGARPLFFQSCIILPARAPTWAPLAAAREIHRAARHLGVAVTGGHTEVSPVVTQPVIVGTMLGVARRLVRSAGARPKQLLVQVGFAGIEGSAILARQAPARVLAKLEKAERRWVAKSLAAPPISVVDQALAATKLGASAMHDPTEGGIAAGVHELAMASHCALEIDLDRVLQRPATLALCDYFGLDPLTLLSSGALLVAMPESKARNFLSYGKRKGWAVALIGRVGRGRGIRATKAGKRVTLAWPSRDAIAELVEEE